MGHNRPPSDRPQSVEMTQARTDAGRLLELLARDASREELEEPLRTARAAGADPTELAELAAHTELAVRVRATLDQRRRREVELAALVDTAYDLAGLRELDDVLAAIVHRARQLLGTDVAYMTLTDAERGDTYMRVTDGSVSARFQRVRLPPGAGLGGLVAQTAAPYSTPNYQADARFAHQRDIDDAVAEEGLVAILGVPLALGTHVIGVLFAANRQIRPFAREEVSLLASLGALAAVAIDGARLLTETQRHSAEVERAADAHEAMTALVLHGGNVRDVAAAVVEVLRGGLVVLDAERRELAAVGDPVRDPVGDRVGDPVAAAVDFAAAADAVRRSARSVAVDVPGAGRCFVAAVLAGGDPLGYLVLHGRGELDGAERRILERGAQVTALLLLLLRAQTEAESRVRGELLTDLLAVPDRDPDRLRERALRLSVDLAVPHVVVAASADGVGRHRLASAAAGLAAERHGLAGEHAGAVVVLLPGGDPGAAARLVSQRLTAAVRSPVGAGGAGPASGPAGLAGAHAEARRCLDALAALGRPGDAACPADLGFAGMLLADADGAAVGAFVDAAIGPVLRYDTRRGTDLAGTLEVYFAHGRSPARCAGPLHVHTNTVLQRLDRVRRLIGDGWTEPERALQIQLALRLHRLRRPPSGDSVLENRTTTGS